MTKKRLLVFFLMFFIFVACRPGPDISGLISTNNPESMRSAFFQADDLDWPKDLYTEITQNIHYIQDFPIPSDIMAVRMAAKPDSVSGKGQITTNYYTALQTIYKYTDEETAIEVFATEAKRNSEIRFPEKVYFVPELNNLVTGCNNSYSSGELGNYRSCYFIGQYGRYFTRVYMVIDNDVIQIKDYEDLINAVQDRLIAHVDQEAND